MSRIPVIAVSVKTRLTVIGDEEKLHSGSNAVECSP
jgi:hypothetical protein